MDLIDINSAAVTVVRHMQRGDTYRARALALMQQIRYWKSVGRVSKQGAPAVTEAVNLASTYVRKWREELHQREAAERESAELAGLLREAQKQLLRPYTYTGDGGWQRIPLDDAIDAALARHAAGRAGADTGENKR